jgi:hypothetical protein
MIYLPHRAGLSLTGPDTLVLLERLVTNATNDWDLGTTRYGALLTPQGKVLSDFLALRITDGVLLDVSADHVDDLAKRLKMFRLRSNVEIARLENLVIMAGIEDTSNDVPSLNGAAYVYQDPRYPGGRVRSFVTLDQVDQDQSMSAYHADRITHGIPEQGFDFGAAEVFPADINMDVLGGVALKKGCFVGQEVVSRMHRRGQIRKRTLRFSVDARSAIETGAELLAPAPVGTVSSYEGDHGLARIRVDRLIKAEAAGATVTLNETPVTITKPDWLVREQDAMKQT